MAPLFPMPQFLASVPYSLRIIGRHLFPQPVELITVMPILRAHVRDLPLDDEHGLVRQHALGIHWDDVDVDERGDRRRIRLAGGRCRGEQRDDGKRKKKAAENRIHYDLDVGAAILNAVQLSRSTSGTLLEFGAYGLEDARIDAQIDFRYSTNAAFS